MGYWILIAMMGCALAAAVVALTIERRAAGERAVRRSAGANRWLAVVGEGQNPVNRAWAGQLAELVPPGHESPIVTAPGATTSDLRPAVARAVVERVPDALVIWTALDDVLGGVPLGEHESVLSALLSDLAEAEVTAVVGNVPNLARLSSAAAAGLPAPELELLTERWNASIARLTYHHAAFVADLRDLIPGPPEPREDDPEAIDQLTFTVASAAVAAKFAPALQQALVAVRRHDVRDVGEPA